MQCVQCNLSDLNPIRVIKYVSFETWKIQLAKFGNQGSQLVHRLVLRSKMIFCGIASVTIRVKVLN